MEISEKIVVIFKSDKVPNVVTSLKTYVLIAVKIFGKIILNRLNPTLELGTIMPELQFGFRKKYSANEQVHRIVHTIKTKKKL